MDERKLLKEWRWLHGMSQRELAFKAGISHVSLHKFETGKYRPDKEAAVKLEVATDGCIRAEKLMDLDGLRRALSGSRGVPGASPGAPCDGRDPS